MISFVCFQAPNPSAAQAADKPTEGEVSQLIGELGSLPSEFDRAAFLGRPAMSKLVVQGAYSYPSVRRAFMESESWSVALSAGFLCTVIRTIPDQTMQERLQTFLKHSEPSARVVAASLLVYGETGPIAQEILNRPLEKEVFSRIRLRPLDLGWLGDQDLVNWTNVNLEAIRRESALVDPPAWEPEASQGAKPDVDNLLLAGMRQLTQTTDLARIGIANALRGANRGHIVLENAVTAAEGDQGSEPGRLGLHFMILGYTLEHSDKSCGEKGCDLSRKYAERILAVCEKWLSTSNDTWVLYNGLNALSYAAGVGSTKALNYLIELAKSSPNPQLRSLAALKVKSLMSRWEREKGELERAKAHREKSEAQKAARYTPKPHAPKTLPPSKDPQKSNEGVRTENRSWIGVSMFVVLLVVILVLLRKRTLFNRARP